MARLEHLPIHPIVNWKLFLLMTFSYLTYATFAHLNYPPVEKPEPFGQITELASCVLLTITAAITFNDAQKQRHFRAAFLGIILLGLSMAIDTVDEWYQVPSEVDTIPEKLTLVLGFIALLCGFWNILLTNHQTINTLQAAAETDPLTGLYNRRKIQKEWLRETGNVSKTIGNLSLITIDIDHFKQINDTLGHDKGDDVLVNLAKILKQNSRTTDYLGRVGGEEFEILQPRTDLKQAIELAERLRFTIAQLQPNSLARGLEKLTVSIGVSQLYPGESYSLVRKRSDLALYKAKTSGRNQVIAARRDSTFNEPVFESAANYSLDLHCK